MIRTHILDASAIVKLVVSEPDSGPLREYVGQHAVLIAFTPCFIEAMSVLKGKLRRGNIREQQYHAACEELVALVRNENLLLEGAIRTDRAVFDQAEALAQTYSIDLIDAYQLLIVKEGFLSQFRGTDSEPILITADEALASAAREEKLRVWHCCSEDAP